MLSFNDPIAVMLRAAGAGQTTKVIALLAEGVSPNCQDTQGDTPLHKAASMQRTRTARVLLKAGAKVDAQNARGETPLMLAAHGDERRALSHTLFLNLGIPTSEMRSGKRNTLARLLLAHGADPNQQDSRGRRALHFAAHHRNFEFSIALLEAGADPYASHLEGSTAIDIAGQRGELTFLFRLAAELPNARDIYREAVELSRWMEALNMVNMYAQRHFNALQPPEDAAKQALALKLKTSASEAGGLWRAFSFSTEVQRMQIIRRLNESWYGLLTLVVTDQQIPLQRIERVYSEVLRRKGLFAEVSVAQHDSVQERRYPQLSANVARLYERRKSIATVLLLGADPDGVTISDSKFEEWEKDKDRLEALLANQLPLIDAQRRVIEADAASVAAELPLHAVLVEYVRFRQFNFDVVPAATWGRTQRQWGENRYLAFIVRNRGRDPVRMVDLGAADRIDRAVADFLFWASRRPVANEEEDNRLAVDLHQLVFAPLVATGELGAQLIIAGDGELSRLPFEALCDPRGCYIADEHVVSYMTCGRDLLPSNREARRRANAPVVIAAPSFNKGAEPMEEEAGTRNLNRWRFLPLEGTLTEGATVAGLLGVEPWLGEEASKARLMDAQSPRILHLATHAFFVRENELEKKKPRASMGDEPELSAESSLGRAGLALAGANLTLRERTDGIQHVDGIVTGTEIATLDLRNTELVVLSACDTGVGDVSVGEGVFGLRHASVVAGARTLIMSLWRIADRETSNLMKSFYSRLTRARGRPICEVFHEVQAEFRRRHRHPYYWAAFICQGGLRAYGDGEAREVSPNIDGAEPSHRSAAER